MFEIVTEQQNEEVLRKRCEEVTVFDEKLKKLVNKMEKTMTTPDPETDIKGIGLAANQVGISQRIMIVTLNYETKKKWKITPMVNPQIIEFSTKEVAIEEGCLSVPGVFEKVKRPSKIKVKWQNVKGNVCEKKLEKWDARIFLHEYDHLEGKLFTDYL